LRAAACYARADEALARDGVSRIDVIKEPDKTHAWEQRFHLPLGTFCESYQQGYRVARAFAHLRRYSFDTGPLQTFLDLLHVGDVLSAHLVANNNNGYANDADLHVDYLYFCIIRGKKRMEFLIEVSVCKDNLARMCSMELGSEYGQ
jgi:hypothetical protein